MATKIVKATDPDIIPLTGIVYTGYYFNPVTNKAYSDMVPGYGPERLYELKPTPSGKYRFRDRTLATYEIHAIVKMQSPLEYNKIMAIKFMPPVKKLPDNLKVRVQNKQEFDQIVAVLKKDGRDWRNSQQPWDSNVVGVYAANSYILYTDSKREFRDDSSQEMTVNQILKIMNEPTAKQLEAKQVFKSFKIMCKNWEQAEQIIEKLKAEGYTLKTGVYGKVMPHVKCFVVDNNGTYDWFAVYDSWTSFGISNAPEITFEEYCGSKSAPTQQTSPPKGWIIGNLNAKSKIEISDNPRIHSTIDSAETERLRLMNAHVGETFVILEIKSYGKVETNPVTKIW